MIHPTRLQKYITSREWKHSRDYMLGLYSSMTVKQRLEIKNLLKKNARITPSYNKR